jgi:hypothetical protein
MNVSELSSIQSIKISCSCALSVNLDNIDFFAPCWEDETAIEKKEAKEWIDKMNALLDPKRKMNWELETRMNVRKNLERPKPKWRFIGTTGKLERKASRWH